MLCVETARSVGTTAQVAVKSQLRGCALVVRIGGWRIYLTALYMLRQITRLAQLNSRLMPISAPAKLAKVQPIVLAILRTPFNDPAWLFRLKNDGFTGMLSSLAGMHLLFARQPNDSLSRTGPCRALPSQVIQWLPTLASTSMLIVPPDQASGKSHR